MKMMKKILFLTLVLVVLHGFLSFPLAAGEIHRAAEQGNAKKVEQYLKENPELLNAGDSHEGRTPLHWAALGGSTEVVALLIAKGAQVHAKDRDGQMPIHTASTEAVAGLLIGKGADIAAMDNYGRTPLHYAAYYGKEKMVEFSLNSGVQINLPDEDGNTPLLLAIENGRRGAALLLISRGAKVNTANREGSTPLRAAKKKGQKEVIEALVKKEARE